jgi:catechol 2,3-dioxygenase-like lactoylglutathione lyase family enzyme
MDYKLELVMIPVSDVDRAKRFYSEQAGFQLDVDTPVGENMRVIQLTPPGSSCSIVFGNGLTDVAPGSLKGTHLVVSDIEQAREQLRQRGVDVSEVRHMKDGQWNAGADPQRQDYNSFADFKDPDGNVWVLQERGRASGN